MAREDFAPATAIEYDEEEIVTRSADEHGHNFSPRATMPKTMGAILTAFVEDRENFPEYTTVAAFIRDAVHHRAEFWRLRGNRRISPEAERSMRIEAAIIEAERYEAMLAEVKRVTKKYKSAVASAIAAQDHEIAEQLLTRFEQLAVDEFVPPHSTEMLAEALKLRARL